MNDDRKRRQKRLAIVIALLLVVVAVILAVAIPALNTSRNTAARDACIRNLRMIDDAKRQWESEHSTSAEKSEMTNANKASQAIGAPGAPQPER